MRLPLTHPHAGWSDERLVRACLDGDDDAWAALIDKYKRLIYSVPIKYGASPEDAADIFQVPLFGMINTCHDRVYTARGHRFVAEFYADLDYGDDGGLIITREHAAVDPARAAAICKRAVETGRVASVHGVDIPVRADIICVHSDTPNAVALATAVRAAVG